MSDTDSIFNADTFLAQEHDEVLDTVVVPIPVGEFVAHITKLTPKLNQASKKDPTSVYHFLDVEWEIDDEEVKAKLGRDTVKVKQSLLLDINEANKLDSGKGKNVPLGQLRAACNQNSPGQKFAFGNLLHQVCLIRTKQRQDPNSDQIFTEVKSVAAMS